MGVVGYFSFYAFKPLYNRWRLSKEIPRARSFLKKLDERFPPKKIDNKQREEREKIMIESGFSPQSIMIAQTQKPSDVEIVVEWFQRAIEENGLSEFEAEKLLIEHGWKQKIINKAKKKLFKLNKGGLKNDRRKADVPTIPRDRTGTGAGARAGNGSVEHKRVLPVSTPESIGREESVVERADSKLKWDWESFNKNRGDD